MTGEDPIVALAHAQRRNGLLQGDELVAAANTAADLARNKRTSLIAGYGAGERIIGAAIALSADGFLSVDLTRRFGGQTLMIISGVVAGSVGLAQSAMLALLARCSLEAGSGSDPCGL